MASLQTNSIRFAYFFGVAFLCSDLSSNSQGAEDVFAREVKRGADKFEFVYRVKLPQLTGPAKLWMPLPPEDSFQEVGRERISAPGSKEITERTHGNRILFLNVGPEDSGKTIEATYRVKRAEKAAYEAAANNAVRYLKPERLVPLTENFKSIAQEVTKGEVTALDQGRALYDHTRSRMKYDKSGTGWGRGDAQFACDVRAGNCTDFHAYFIALARSVGIPARFAIGFTIPANTNEGIISGYHCWAEFLADGKWIPVDISEASKYPELADYYFGHHPANRFELSKGRDLVFEPAPASSPVNFLVYPLLEIEGKPVKTENEFLFKRAGS